MSNKQCNTKVELVPTFTLFLELQFAVVYGLVNTVICVVSGSKWMTSSQSCQMASNCKQLLSFQCTKIKLSSLLASYGKDTVEISTVHHWLRKSRDCGPDWPVRIWKTCHRNSKTEQQKLDKVIHENRVIHQTATVEKLNSGLSNVNKNIGLGCKKLCGKWLLQQFLPIMKTARLEACQQLHAHYESDRNDFLYSNVTADKSWVHHCDQKMKSQSLEYRYPTCSRKNTF